MPQTDKDWPLDQPLILEGVHARRRGVEVLRGIDLTFPPGSRTTIIGPSGAGKSTLLRLLNRLADPSAGRIMLGDTPITVFPATRLRRRIGLVFQSPRLLPGLVSDNLSYQNTLLGDPAPVDTEGALSEVGLDPTWSDRDAAGLSGGERQRLALAMALQTRPAILGLDEPTSALDPSSARQVADILRARSKSAGLTTIAVTHNRDHAAWLGDITIVLEAGRLVDRGPTAEVLARDDASFWAKKDAV